MTDDLKPFIVINLNAEKLSVRDGECLGLNNLDVETFNILIDYHLNPDMGLAYLNSGDGNFSKAIVNLANAGIIKVMTYLAIGTFIFMKSPNSNIQLDGGYKLIGG